MAVTNLTIFLKELREGLNLTVSKAASELNLSAPYLSDLEKGNRTPSRSTISALINLYNLDEDKQRRLYDAVGDATDSLPYDIVDFLKSNQDAKEVVIGLMNAKKKELKNR